MSAAASTYRSSTIYVELQASMPVVFRVSAQDYRMWAYGRELNFSSQYTNSSFGRSGYFTSVDGVHWRSMPGMHCTWSAAIQQAA